MSRNLERSEPHRPNSSNRRDLGRPKSNNPKPQNIEVRNRKIPKFRNIGISESRHHKLGKSVYRNLEISKLRNRGIASPRNPGCTGREIRTHRGIVVPKSRNTEIAKPQTPTYRGHVTSKYPNTKGRSIETSINMRIVIMRYRSVGVAKFRNRGYRGL